jgi:alkylated DNA repair dioxygenase AlkB
MPRVNPDAEVERVQLDEGAWVDVYRGWLDGADEMFDHLREKVAWQTSRLFRYDHWVEENRLGAMWRRGAPLPHADLAQVHKTLQRNYDVQFNSFGLMHYRNGRDGQAFHRDTDMRWLDDTVIAILTLGAARPWLMRPRANRYDHSEDRGTTHDLRPGNGDLIVMGGRCQADWEHSVAYLGGRPVGSRVSLQWRYTSRTGRPFMGSSYSAPLTYNR